MRCVPSLSHSDPTGGSVAMTCLNYTRARRGNALLIPRQGLRVLSFLVATIVDRRHEPMPSVRCEMLVARLSFAFCCIALSETTKLICCVHASNADASRPSSLARDPYGGLEVAISQAVLRVRVVVTLSPWVMLGWAPTRGRAQRQLTGWAIANPHPPGVLVDRGLRSGMARITHCVGSPAAEERRSRSNDAVRHSVLAGLPTLPEPVCSQPTHKARSTFPWGREVEAAWAVSKHHVSSTPSSM
ncbi:hypothetical protein BGZ63DRAFT_431854 [Mariannaea sp. PMI_226]|nr:hypothetical protein BGZ63DRAFT_431854 [Mariannaea sp. PMI_226]